MECIQAGAYIESERYMIKKRFRNWFRNQRIGPKLMWINTVTMVVASLLILTLIVAIQTYTKRGELLDQVRVQAMMNAESLGATLAFNDPASANELLDKLKDLGFVDRAELYSQDGKLFASFSKNNQVAETKLSTLTKGGEHSIESSDYGWLSLKYVRLISARGTEVGHIYLEANLHQVYRQLIVFMGMAIVAIILAATIGLYILTRLQKYITSPLINLTGLMDKISEDKNYALRFKLDTKDEIGEMAHGFNSMLQQIEQKNVALDNELQERKKSEMRLDRLAHFDMVTQLPNRYFFNRRLATEKNEFQVYGTEFGLMFIDLDNFKIINDTLGHHVGDDLLRQVSERFKSSVRSGDTVARLGGDEFGVILANLTHEADAAMVATKIKEKLKVPFLLGGHEIVVSASIGISLFPHDTENIDEIMQFADTAMYQAKDKGKNNFQFFTESLRGIAHHRMVMESQIRHAIHENEFFLSYQPQFDVLKRQIVGVEALIRWQHKDLGRINPGEFIPIAEETGLIVPIGEWVLRTACLQSIAWQKSGVNLGIAVNVSGRQFREENLVERFKMILIETGADPSKLELELTESSLMESTEPTIDKLNALTALGFKLSIDDFGTGYSSMSYLKRYPISKLKIDRSFVTDISFDSEDQAIAKAIIALGTSMEMRIIAEGIENEAQLSKLLELGCHQGQGFLVSPAVSADQVVSLYDKGRFSNAFTV